MIPGLSGEKLRSQLKPGGILIITTPDADGPISNFKTSPTDLPPHHVSRWNASSMRAFGERFGLVTRLVAREPLPSYVWKYYLPAMIRNSNMPQLLKGRLLNHNRVERFLSILEKIGITELPPLPGHSLYVEFQG